jgi:hypothetical protein
VDLVKTVMRLDFVEALRPWLELRGLFRVAGEDPNAEIQGSALSVMRQSKKQRLTMNVRGVVFEHESANSLESAITESLDLARELNDASPLPRVGHLRFDAIFIESFPLPFHELVAQTKKYFFHANDIVNAATDIGVTLDTNDGELTRHRQIGPMLPEQLQTQFLAFPKEKLPSQFLFMGLAHSRTVEKPYDAADLRNFLNQAAEWQMSNAQEFVRTITAGKGT